MGLWTASEGLLTNVPRDTVLLLLVEGLSARKEVPNSNSLFSSQNPSARHMNSDGGCAESNC